MYIVPVTSILSWRNDFDILSKPAKYSDISDGSHTRTESPRKFSIVRQILIFHVDYTFEIVYIEILHILFILQSFELNDSAL